MSTLVKDTVNFGIGAISTAQEQAEKVLAETQSRISELISLGEVANDEGSVKVKEAVRTAVSSATELQQKAQLFVEEIVSKVQNVTVKEEKAPAATAQAN